MDKVHKITMFNMDPKRQDIVRTVHPDFSFCASHRDLAIKSGLPFFLD